MARTGRGAENPKSSHTGGASLPGEDALRVARAGAFEFFALERECLADGGRGAEGREEGVQVVQRAQSRVAHGRRGAVGREDRRGPQVVARGGLCVADGGDLLARRVRRARKGGEAQQPGVRERDVARVHARRGERHDVERAQLDAVQSPKAYSIRLLKNLCLNRIRKARQLRFQPELPEAETGLPQDDTLDARQRLDKVLEGIKSLPERQREILILRSFEGCSYAEIARKTGMSPASARVQLARARKTLKTKQ